MDYPTDKTTHELRPQDTEDAGFNSQSKNVEEIIVPVLREEFEVHKEIRKTGIVRVRKTVHESEEVVTESLTSETVDIERVPMDLIVDTPPPVRTEGEVMIIPVVKEELVVTKQLRVVEELRVTKRRSVSDYHENVTVRAEEAIIERVNPESLETETNKVQG